MSVYITDLDLVARKRYQDKLGLNEVDDPYSPQNQSKFVDDMCLWPPVEYGHIFCYFIERPGVYTRKQLLQWKSMDAYNYFQSGHVRTILINKLPRCLILMAYVNPSQSSPDKGHTTWVATEDDGTIITCHCDCMAG